VACTGQQRNSAAIFSVQQVRSEAETSKAASFKTAAFVYSATPPELNRSVDPIEWVHAGQRVAFEAGTSGVP
jgi:hypothetical protein